MMMTTVNGGSGGNGGGGGAGAGYSSNGARMHVGGKLKMINKYGYIYTYTTK